MKNKLLFLASLIFLCQTFLAYGQDLKDVRTGALKGTVALTFDDGPNPISTPQILAILKKNDIKATFFVMGPLAKKYPELIHQMLKEGHAVADHTNSHPMLTKLSNKQLEYEVVKSKEYIASVTGVAPVCLRPPFGMGNKRVGEYIREHGMIMVAMGFNSFDYNSPGVEKLKNWVVDNAISGRVFLMHDGYNERKQTVAALPGIIEGIRKKGLGFSAICYPNAEPKVAGNNNHKS